MSKDEELNLNTKWENVLNLIRNDEFSNKYKDYVYIEKDGGYLIKEKKNPDKYFFLFDEQKIINIYFDEENFQSIEVYTSLEIDRFIKAKNKEINDVYFQDDKDIKYYNNIDNLGVDLDNNKGLEFVENEPLGKLEYQKSLNRNMDYTPNQYSKYFYDYFTNEDKNGKSTTIKFENNIIRKKIFMNVINLRDKKNLKTFKFTGPSSIGKSFTLFRLCHTFINMAYINLKILYNYRADLHKTYSIIISELQRFTIRKNLDEINKLIQNNYNNNNSYLELLLSIMEFLDKASELEFDFVFAFDQFKSRYIRSGFMETIQKFNKIKIVLCSSINDKNIREECCKTWLIKGKNLYDLKEDNQEYYFYFKKIYNYKEVNKKSLDPKFKMLGYMPKYINK